MEDLVALLDYLDTPNHSDMKLAKRLQAEFHSHLPAKSPAPSVLKPKGSRSRGEHSEQQDTPHPSHVSVVAILATPPVAAESAHNKMGDTTAKGAASMEVQQASSRAIVMQLPDPFRMFPKKNGEYLALDDETPKIIASKFSIDLDALITFNKHMYDGLYAGARFKGGTLVFLPTPTMASLRRPVTATPLELFGDLLKMITTEFDMLPLCPRIVQVLAQWRTVMQELLVDRAQHHTVQHYKAFAHATLALEHTLALPLAHWADAGDEPLELRAADARLLSAHWISDVRQTWVMEMESVATMAQLGLLVEELHLFAFAGLRDLRHHCTSSWFFSADCKKLKELVRKRSHMDRAAVDVDKPLAYIPDMQDRVIYFRKGHLMHLSDSEYPERPWDCCPDVRFPMAVCSVEEKVMYRQSNHESPAFCAIRLLPICHGKDLVNKKILVYSPGISGQVVPPMPYTVTDFRQTTADVPHVPMPHGGGGILPGVPTILTATAAGSATAGLAGSTSQMPHPTASAPGAQNGGIVLSTAVAGAGGEVVYTQRTVNEHLLRLDAPGATAAGSQEQWVNLDFLKYSVQR